MDEFVALRREGPIAWLTLRRPDKLNALSTELLAQGVEALRQVAEDELVRCLILNGEGRAFCAGADLNSMRDLTPSRALRRFSRANIWLLLEELPQPTIAAVHGYCFGAGGELALACDFRVGAAAARIGHA